MSFEEIVTLLITDEIARCDSAAVATLVVADAVCDEPRSGQAPHWPGLVALCRRAWASSLVETNDRLGEQLHEHGA